MLNFLSIVCLVSEARIPKSGIATDSAGSSSLQTVEVLGYNVAIKKRCMTQNNGN